MVTTKGVCFTCHSPPIVQFENVREGKVQISDVCIGCGELKVHIFHPLFEGGFCVDCKVCRRMHVHVHVHMHACYMHVTCMLHACHCCRTSSWSVPTCLMTTGRRCTAAFVVEGMKSTFVTPPIVPSEYACVCVCVCVFVSVSVFACTCVCMYLCLYVHVFVCTCVCMYLCLYVHVFVCTCVCMYMCLYVHVCVCVYCFNDVYTVLLLLQGLLWPLH